MKSGTPLTLGTRLAFARNAKALSQAELAQASGVSRTMISDYERDVHVPVHRHLRNLAETLERSIPWLQGDE